jgi:integrase
MYRKALKIPTVSLGASHTLYIIVFHTPMERVTSLRHIQAALGHKSSKTTEIYTRVLAMNKETIGYCMKVLT